ncbi:hypothetical protein [Streptomyces europaeiscabiei]|nr:hypothetical protein OHB30_10750 [Streptomyces europaeiscabiei]
MKRRNAAWKRSGTRKSARQLRAREVQPRNRVRAQLRAVRLTTGAV